MERQFFAQLDENNVVIDVHCVTQEFLQANPERYKGVWVETFFNAPDKTYAGIGYTWDPVTDVFIAPQPYASWTLDENNDWQPPTPMPSIGGPYKWSEEDLEWVAI